MKYKVWVHVEAHCEETDTYEEITMPEPVFETEDKEEAIEFANSLASQS